MFIATGGWTQVNAAGTMLWTLIGGGGGEGGALAVATDAQRNILISGSFRTRELTFGHHNVRHYNADVHEPPNNTDVFLAKVRQRRARNTLK